MNIFSSERVNKTLLIFTILYNVRRMIRLVIVNKEVSQETERLKDGVKKADLW